VAYLLELVNVVQVCDVFNAVCSPFLFHYNCGMVPHIFIASKTHIVMHNTSLQALAEFQRDYCSLLVLHNVILWNHLPD